MADKKTIITIGRQYGSGGHEIGATLAQDLGLKLYDKEMLKRAAKESGLCEELFETHDEKPTHSFLYSLVMDSYSFGYSGGAYADIPINHKIFLAQYDAIKSIANEGDCVIVGRCADYALANCDEAVNVFIYADLQSRIRRIARMYNLTDAQAKDIILKADKKRSNYYNYYTNKIWGDARNYDLCLNSAKLGIGGTAQAIMDYLKLKNKIQNPKI